MKSRTSWTIDRDLVFKLKERQLSLLKQNKVVAINELAEEAIRKFLDESYTHKL